MPRARKGDERVAIVGARVKDAREWKGLSTHEMAAALNRRHGANFTTQQTVSLIENGQPRCRRELRRALAKLFGPPVTEAWLAGEQEFLVPPLLWPPSGTRTDLELPTDANGQPATRAASTRTPRYELEALALGKAFAGASGRDESFERVQPEPQLENALRWALSLALWREFVNEDRFVDVRPDRFAREADAFAYHLGEALRLLFRPWLENEYRLRPRMLYRLMHALDSVAGESVAYGAAGSREAWSDIAILDALGYWPAEHRAAVRTALEARRDAGRARGQSETAIARELLAWERVSDEDIARIATEEP